MANVTSGQRGLIIPDQQSKSRQHTLTHCWAALLPLWNSHCYIIISFQSFTGITPSVTLEYQQEQLSIYIIQHHFCQSWCFFSFEKSLQ